MRRAVFIMACCIAMLCTASADSFKIEDLEALKQRSKHAHPIKTFSSSTLVTSGWSLYRSPATGINIQKTFAAYPALKIFAVEPLTGEWAFFTAGTIDENPNMFILDSLEPDILFYVWSSKDVEVDQIAITTFSSHCLNASHDTERYTILTDSGLDDIHNEDTNRSISFRSRQKSLFGQFHYGDTRLALLVPKIALQSKQIRKYGPAEPKSHIIFGKDYENSHFYIFNFRNKTCYKGIFPSKDMPPFAILNRTETE